MLTLPQQVFCLSWLSNKAMGQTGTMSALQAAVGGAVQDFMTVNAAQMLPWRVVWGPVAVGPAGGTYNNLMYVAAAPKQLVVAVAATNFSSLFDWTAEDLSVGTMLPWTYGPAGAAPAWISKATATGLSALLAMTDPAGGKLLAFLQAYIKANPGLTLSFAGHSLAGALVPALTLALLGQNGGPFAGTTLQTLPSAGATPGDAGFAALYRAAVAQEYVPYPMWGPRWFNADIVNFYDIVPTAWNALNLRQIYDVQGAALGDALGLLNDALNRLRRGLVYAPIPQGTFIPKGPQPRCASFAQFADLVLQNHLRAYPAFFGVAPLFTPQTEAMVTASQPGLMARMQALLQSVGGRAI